MDTPPITPPTNTSPASDHKITAAPATTSAPRRKKMMLGIIIGIVVLLFVIPVITFLLGIYSFGWTGSAVDAITKAIPLPAASVNNTWISYAEWREGVVVVNRFYDKQEQLGLGATNQFTPEEIEQKELDRLIDRELLNQLGTQYQITVSDEEIETEYQNEILPQAGGGEEEVVQTIEELYGWDLATFKAEVLREVVLRRKVQTAMNADDTVNGAAREKIEAAKAELDGGALFADVAKKYSDDGSAEQGGDLGFIEKGQTVEEFESVAFATEVGAVSDIFTTDFGNHFLSVTEKKDETVKVSHVLTRFVDVDERIVALKEEGEIEKFVGSE